MQRSFPNTAPASLQIVVTFRSTRQTVPVRNAKKNPIRFLMEGSWSNGGFLESSWRVPRNVPDNTLPCFLSDVKHFLSYVTCPER